MKTALVTGGTKGIGRAVAELLLTRGWRVVVNYAHDSEAAQEMERQWTEKAPGRWTVVQADQRKREDTYRLTDAVRNIAETVDCIVCNAGLTVRHTFNETTDVLPPWRR